tara:strand:+ start:16389 stop:17414 length:1026 start_codon:yes stop_codon:yes gene_type:complete
MLIKLPILFFVVSLISVLICKKFNLLIDNKSEKHKKYTSKYKSHLLGGPLLSLLFIYYYIFFRENIFFICFCIVIFFIGFLSDLKKMNSVSLRFFLQIVTIICFVQILNIEIERTNFNFFDDLLKNNFLNIIFVTFCLTILVNGTNFVDGINGLVILYHIIIYLILYTFFQNFFFDKELVSILILCLTILLIINFSGYLYLGDSGSYLLSIFTGTFLINFASKNTSISPYLIIIFLWYPCFELLFSMIRRITNNNKTYKPDTNHLHQLIFRYVKKNLTSLSNFAVHLFTTLSINTYNLFCFLLSIQYKYNSTVLIFILILNIFFYILIFFTINKKLSKLSL